MNTFLDIGLILFGCFYGVSVWRDDREMGRVIKAFEKQLERSGKEAT